MEIEHRKERNVEDNYYRLIVSEREFDLLKDAIIEACFAQRQHVKSGKHNGSIRATELLATLEDMREDVKSARF